MGTQLLLLLALAAAPSALPPPTPLEVKGAGTVVTGTARGRVPDRFRLVPAEKGTIIISLEPIQGPPPRARLKNAQGKTVRRSDRRGKIWARPAAATELFLEVSGPDPDVGSTYQLSVSFDVDRPRALRDQRRPARPRDIVRVTTSAVRDLEQVFVGGMPAEHAIHGSDVLVTIPAFARSGPIVLHFESRPPKVVEVELVGTEPPREDLLTDACAGAEAGCLQLTISPSVGSQWLAAIARVLDADVTRHDVHSGAVELKLRLPSSRSYALELMQTMPGIEPSRCGAAWCAPP